MSPSFHDLLHASRADLAQYLRAGHPIDPTALDHTLYRGVSLGLPRWMEALTWKIFAKTFYRADDGRLYGWNVRLQQTGIDGPIVPQQHRGAPRCFGYYGVTSAADAGLDADMSQGLLIQYRLGPNPALHPIRLARDPLVSLRPNDPSLLLGWSYLHIAGRVVPTPSYFVLRREGPLEHVPAAMLHTVSSQPAALS